jgi:adenylate cyclase class 2
VREVEVKYQIRDKEALLVALKRCGIEFAAPVYQDDQAYAPDGWSYGDAKLGVSFARLRTVDDRHTFTLKRPAENALSCDEYETAIATESRWTRQSWLWASARPCGSPRYGAQRLSMAWCCAWMRLRA